MSRRKTRLSAGVTFDGAVHRFEIRDKRLRGGRFSLSLRTEDADEANQRAAAIRTLMERGDLAFIERLRRGQIHITEVRAAVREADFERLRRANPEALTVGDAVERRKQTLEATRGDSTYKQYKSLLDQLVEHFKAETPLAAVTKKAAEEWLHAPKQRRSKKLPARPWSPIRQSQARQLASGVWALAIAEEAELAEQTGTRPTLTRNPWMEVETPKKRQTRVAFLRPEEWRTLSAKVEDHPNAAFLALGCLAGLRLREVLHLRTDIDVDLEARLLHIQPREGQYRWRPKTDNSIRVVPIGDELHRVLKRHVELGYAGERYFFIAARRDRPMGASAACDRVEASFEAVGIKYGIEGDGLTFHSLRHTFASWLAQRDVNPLKIARLMGDTVEIVMTTYAHLFPSDLERAVKVLDDVVREEAA